MAYTTEQKLAQIKELESQAQLSGAERTKLSRLKTWAKTVTNKTVTNKTVTKNGNKNGNTNGNTSLPPWHHNFYLDPGRKSISPHCFLNGHPACLGDRSGFCDKCANKQAIGV